MNRKTVLFNVLLVFLLSVMFGAGLGTPVLSSPDIITVPDDYPTIKEAIHAARSGDTIIVREGLYAEGEIVVNKPLTLIAEGRVIVDGLHTAENVFRTTQSARSVVIEGFIVKNGVNGILLYSDNCKIVRNTVMNCRVGIRISDWSSNNIVAGNKVLNNSNGIYVGTFNPPPWRSEYNTIEGNIVENNSRGIGIVRSSHNVVKGNRVAHNNWGIFFIFSDNNTITENILALNLEYGVILFLSDYNVVKENTVERNTHYGIEVRSSRGSTIKENIVKKNEYGIAIELWSAGNTIKENKVLRSYEFDLYWDGTGSNIWTENKYKTKTENIIQE